MANAVHLRCVGTPLNQFNCLRCFKALDEEIRDAKKKKELANLAKKRGTMIIQNRKSN